MGFIQYLMKNSSMFDGRFYKSNELDAIKANAGDYDACIEGYTTYRQYYTVDDFRRIIETPRDVTSSYNLEFINDQVIVTLKTITYIYRNR